MFPAGIICKVDPITMLNNNDNSKINDNDRQNNDNNAFELHYVIPTFFYLILFLFLIKFKNDEP